MENEISVVANKSPHSVTTNVVSGSAVRSDIYLITCALKKSAVNGITMMVLVISERFY